MIVESKKEVHRGEVSVTAVPHCKESIEVFAKSKTHGNGFAKTRGRHITHDDAINGRDKIGMFCRTIMQTARL